MDYIRYARLTMLFRVPQNVLICLRCKRTKFNFGWGSAPNPAEEVNRLKRRDEGRVKGRSQGRERRGYKEEKGEYEGKVNWGGVVRMEVRRLLDPILLHGS